MILGIDFGTCFSHVSVLFGENVIDDRVVDESGCSLIPSKYLVYDGKEYFGKKAEDIGRINGIVPISELKTKVRGKEFNLKCPCGDNADNQTYGDVLKKMLGYILELVEKNCSETIDYVTIAAPVSLNSGGMQNVQYNSLLKETVMDYTGLDEKHVFVKEEPVMAAYSYICNNRPKNDKTIMVFDLGGGTLDTSIVRYDPSVDEMEVITTSGEEIGGNQWTQALLKLVKTSMLSIGLPRDYPLDSIFYDGVEDLKRRLSTLESSYIPIVLDDGSEKRVTVTRDGFEVQTADLLDKCRKCIVEMMEKKNYHFDDIDLVVLVGGGSRMPQVQKMFLDFPGMNDSKILSHSPDLAISNGAALFSKRNYKQSGGIAIGPYIRECSTHTYGVEVDNSYYNAPLIKNILFKGEEFIGGNLFRSPKCTFQPGSDDVNHVLFIKVYESDYYESDCDEKGCVHLSKNTVPLGNPIRIPIPEGYVNNPTKYKIRIALNLSSDGTLIVRVSEASTNGRILVERNVAQSGGF